MLNGALTKPLRQSGLQRSQGLPQGTCTVQYLVGVGVHHHYWHHISRSQRLKYSAWIGPKSMVLLLVEYMSKNVTATNEIGPE